MARKKSPQKSAGSKRKATPKSVVEEPLYWTPPVKKAGGVPSSKRKQKIEEESGGEPLYYVPPKTPQEALDRGIVSSTAIRPANFLPHHLRKSPSSRPNPRSWHCIWQCEGVNHPVYSTEWPKATHDYYCPYWEILSLYPEWVEDDDHPLKPWHRPPRPAEENAAGWPPNDQWNRTEWYGFEKSAAESAANFGLKSGSKADPITFGGIVNQENPANHKLHGRRSGRSRGAGKVSPPTWERPVGRGDSFTVTNDDERPTRRNKSRRQSDDGAPF